VPDLETALRMTPDEFCFTLSGNPFPEESIEQLEKCVKTLHKQRVMESRLADSSTTVHEISDIEKRRIAF
jgi:hypothetical protein